MTTRKPRGKAPAGTRKPEGAAKGAAGRPAAPRRSAAKKEGRKPVPEPVPEPPLPPLTPEPTGAPLAFNSRTSELLSPSQVRTAEAAALRGIAARRAFQAIMTPEAPPASPAAAPMPGHGVALSFGPGAGDSGGSGDKERQRLAALRKETAKRPVVSVRPDYFGTAEHRASAEHLASLLSGKSVFSHASRSTARQSHVLLRTAQTEFALDAVLERQGLTVASADPTWREPFQDRLEDLMARYRPLTELEIRPGLTLTYGEVVALAGDYYGTPEELSEELTPAVADAIRGVTPQDEGTFLLNTHRGWFDYVNLANENQDHFAPRSWARYALHHQEALLLALDKDLDAALVRNAFADHFLTDAFASGHLRVPRDLLLGLSGGLPSKKMHDEENVYGLWVRSASGFVWRSYGDDQLGTNPVHLTLTAHAVGLSLLRVFRAYRMEGRAAAGLRAALEEAPEQALTAGQMVSPLTLPGYLGEVAGLPGIREHLPVPLGSAEAPDPGGVLANYPPQVGVDGKRRKGTPDFEAYFRFE
ncbi:hypothetical protein [Stigmatella erecta]|uniref:Uncharacterized protein n=1 Tax=Stigmatella erecta TaxID=83460 RepID=A0A1I0LBW2_9BACT|nr:hypothetical protein [Stigmatella erecta]SEU37554.1 hypothetical protein SAMN05443639_12448 [Stigmatella erecta]